MLGTKFYKDNYDLEEYHKASDWCEPNGAMIVDKGECFEVVEVPVPSVDEVKQNKLATLKQLRDMQEIEPIEYNNYLFDFDEKSRDRINSAIIALSLTNQSIEWTTADNQDVRVTADDLRCVVAKVAQRANALHVAYRVAKAKVEQATTVAEVEAITLI